MTVENLSITVYSAKESESIITYLQAFEEYSILDVIPEEGMMLRYFHMESPDIFIINANKGEYLKIRHLLPDINAKVLLICANLSPGDLFEAFRLGVLGYIEGQINPIVLFEALTQIKNGELHISMPSLKLLVDSFKLGNISILTKREREVLQLLRDGKTYSMIANDLFLSGNTIRTHMQKIYQKLNANSKAEAIEIAVKDRII